MTGKMYDTPLIPFTMNGGATISESLAKFSNNVEKDINTVKNISLFEPHKVLAAAMNILARNDRQIKQTAVDVVDGMSRIMIGQTQSSINQTRTNLDHLLKNGENFIDEYKRIFQSLLISEYAGIDTATLRVLYLKIKNEQAMVNQLYTVLSNAAKELKAAAPLIKQNSAEFTQNDVQTISNFDVFEKIDFEVRKSQSSSALGPIWNMFEPQFARLFYKYKALPHNRIKADKYYKPDYQTNGAFAFTTTWSGAANSDSTLMAFDRELGTILNSFLIMIPSLIQNNPVLKSLRIPLISSASPEQQKLFSKYLVPDQSSNNILFTSTGRGGSNVRCLVQGGDGNFVYYTGSSSKMPQFDTSALAGICCSNDSKRPRNGRGGAMELMFNKTSEQEASASEKRNIVDLCMSLLSDLGKTLKQINTLSSSDLGLVLLQVKQAHNKMAYVRSAFAASSTRKVLITKENLEDLLQKFSFNVVENSNLPIEDRNYQREYMDRVVRYIKVFDTAKQNLPLSNTYHPPVLSTTSLAVVSDYNDMLEKVNQTTLSSFTTGISNLSDIYTVLTIGKINKTMGSPASFEIYNPTSNAVWTPPSNDEIVAKGFYGIRFTTAKQAVIKDELVNFVKNLGLTNLKAEKARLEKSIAGYETLARVAEAAVAKINSDQKFALTKNFLTNLLASYGKDRDYLIHDPGFNRFAPNSIYDLLQKKKALNMDTNSEGEIIQKLNDPAQNIRTIQEVLKLFALNEFTGTGELARTTTSLLLQGLHPDQHHPALHFIDEVKPQAPENETEANKIQLIDSKINIKDGSLYYHAVRAIFMLITALGSDYVDSIDKLFGYQDWLVRNKKCLDALTSKIAYIESAADPKYLQKKFSYNITYAPSKGLHSVLNLLNFEVFMNQPYEAAMLCSGPSGSGKSANTFGVKNVFPGVIEILKGINDGQFFAYDFYSCCFNFVESFREATENAIIINHKLKREERLNTSQPSYTKHSSMEFLASPGAAEVDVDFEEIKSQIDMDRKPPKLSFITDTVHMYMGKQVGNPESSRSIFVFAGRQGANGSLKKLIDIPGYEFVGFPEYLNPFWIGSVRYKDVSVDDTLDKTMPNFAIINTIMQNQDFAKWCQGINFNFNFSNSYSQNLSTWGMAPKAGSNSVNLWALLEQMDRFTFTIPGNPKSTTSKNTILSYTHSEITVGDGNMKWWYLEEKNNQIPKDAAIINGVVDPSKKFVKRPQHKWQIFRDYDCNIIVYRTTFFRVLQGLLKYYETFVKPNSAQKSYPEKVIDFLRANVPINLRGVAKLSLEGFYYNHYNFWTQYATKTRDASMLVDEPAMPESIVMSIYKFILSLSDVNLDKIPDTKKMRERIVFANVTDTLIGGSADTEVGGYEGYDSTVQTNVVPLTDPIQNQKGFTLKSALTAAVLMRFVNSKAQHKLEIFRLSKLLHFGQVRPVDKVTNYAPIIKPSMPDNKKTYFARNDARNMFITLFNGEAEAGYVPYFDIVPPPDPKEKLSFDFECL